MTQKKVKFYYRINFTFDYYDRAIIKVKLILVNC